MQRAFVLTMAYTACVGVADLLTGGNYMYLRQKPASGSLLDLMGPWPLYILGGAGVALVFFAVLAAPFRLSRR